uniref:Uncharacterized protein n=1 Tax=uncultured marine virus TaxID=186617 RepID=A0A0F7L581_9VIRU|nr:hypothetical protein [uncultured marine virus]
MLVHNIALPPLPIAPPRAGSGYVQQSPRLALRQRLTARNVYPPLLQRPHLRG